MIKKLIKIKLIIKMAKIIFWAFLNAIALKKSLTQANNKKNMIQTSFKNIWYQYRWITKFPLIPLVLRDRKKKAYKVHWRLNFRPISHIVF